MCLSLTRPQEGSMQPPAIVSCSELHLRHLTDDLTLAAEIEEFLRREAERTGEQGGRKLLDAGVVFLDCVVEEAAGGGDLVLEIAQLGLQLLGIGVGLEV